MLLEHEGWHVMHKVHKLHVSIFDESLRLINHYENSNALDGRYCISLKT